MTDWGRKKAKERYAEGGSVMSRRDPADAKYLARDLTRHKKDADAGKVSPTASQVFKSGRVGPMNITPKAMPMEPDDRKRGGAVKRRK